MLYDYEVIEVKQRLNKKKVISCLLIILMTVGIFIFNIIKTSEYKNKKTEEQIAVEQIQQDEAKKQEEVRLQKEARKEKQYVISKEPFTEEQMQVIENIYNNTTEKRVFLTFDDGPTQAVTPYILDLLKTENIKATFFVLGNRAKANPNLIKRQFEEGHYIANHGYTHKYSQIYQNTQTVLEEYHYTEQCIQEALGNLDYHSKVFRFPGGSKGGYYHTIKQEAKQVLRQNGIVSLDWNALSKDAEGAKTKEELLQNVITTVGEKQNVVILMHDSADKILTYETLPDIIQYLREKGYQFKTLYDIL